MVTKIKNQEEKLSNVVKEIQNKEEYVKQVHFEMKQIDQINKRIKSELEKTKRDKKVAEKGLKAALAEKHEVLQEIKRKSELAKQHNVKEAEEIKKFRTIVEDKEIVIKE